MPGHRPDQSPPSAGTTGKEVLHGCLSYLRDSALAKVTGVPSHRSGCPGLLPGPTCSA